jgi:(1->4)-alpha-D-glucan 1-alpha-D-glucosylmutase
MATHSRILEWLRTGVLDGVRVDHPDGLRDPQQYFARLRAAAPDAWIVAEKILQPSEVLRANWPIEGTTGYDFLNVCNGLLVNGEGLEEIDAIYREFTGNAEDYDSLVYSKKLAVEHEALGSDVNRLAQIFVEICENNRDRRDYTRAEIRRAIREVAAGFAIYRTYVIPQRSEIAEEDKTAISSAVAIAKTRRTDIDPALFDFIGDVLTLRVRGELEDEFLLRFQQFTSPVMAKGVEDTVFYCFNRMIGLERSGRVAGTQWRRPRANFTPFATGTHALSANHEYPFDTRHQTLRRCAGAPGGLDGDSRAVARGAAPVVAHEPPFQSRQNSPIATRNIFSIKRSLAPGRSRKSG